MDRPISGLAASMQFGAFQPLIFMHPHIYPPTLFWYDFGVHLLHAEKRFQKTVFFAKCGISVQHRPNREFDIVIFRPRFIHMRNPTFISLSQPCFRANRIRVSYFANFKIRVSYPVPKMGLGGCYDFFTLANRRSFFHLYYPM